MNIYQTERVARQQASARTNKTGIEHFAEESESGWLVGATEELDVAFGRVRTVQPPDTLTTRFAFAGEDDRYVKVSVDGKVFSIAKSRARYQTDGERVTLTLTRKYAHHRPELGITE